MRNGRRRASAATKAPGAAPADDQAFALEGRHRLPDHRAADPEAGHQALLGRQPLAGLELPADDLPGEPCHEPAGEARRRGALAVRRTARSGPLSLDHRCCPEALVEFSYLSYNFSRRGYKNAA